MVGPPSFRSTGNASERTHLSDLNRPMPDDWPIRSTVISLAKASGRRNALWQFTGEYPVELYTDYWFSRHARDLFDPISDFNKEIRSRVKRGKSRGRPA